MILPRVIGGGVFTAANIATINANFAALPGIDVWVRPQVGINATADGTYAKPYATMAGLARLLKPGLVIGLQGVLFEEYVFPLGVNDLTIVGVAGQPRQATTSGVANGGGATWMTPTAGATTTTTPLVTVRAQGTTFQNIYFNSSATAAPAVSLLMNGAGDPPVDASAEHTSFVGCFFTGAATGVTSSGGPNFCSFDGCRFFGFSGTGDTAISTVTGAGVHTNYGWVIKNCEFWGNDIHIDVACSGASIHDNNLSFINNLITTSVFYDGTGGKDNMVFRNNFGVNSGNAGIAAMFVLGSNDRFAANSLSTAVTTTQFSWGDPA